MMNQSLIQMPKACIACASFTPIGKKKDANLPADLQPRFSKPGSWPFGMCSKANSHVWGTELCSKFEADDLIEVVDITQQRQAPIEPRQDVLF